MFYLHATKPEAHARLKPAEITRVFSSLTPLVPRMCPENVNGSYLPTGGRYVLKPILRHVYRFDDLMVLRSTWCATMPTSRWWISTENNNFYRFYGRIFHQKTTSNPISVCPCILFLLVQWAWNFTQYFIKTLKFKIVCTYYVEAPTSSKTYMTICVT